MTFTGKTAVVAMCLIVLVKTVNAIRRLKDVPKSGPDSRLYKYSIQSTPAVHVQCTDDTMVVKVRADIIGNGHRVTADQVHLGPAGSTRNCVAVRLNDVEYVIEAGLHECGSETWTEDDNLVYANTLFYTPTPSTLGIVRSDGAAVRVECHYKRIHFVSSNYLQSPTWKKSRVSTKAAPQFCLKLMTDDWMAERTSSVYRRHNIINMEASVTSAHETPVKLFLDNCAAALGPDSGSTSRYPLIHNHGCAAKTMSLQSSICFKPRKEHNVLRVQMDALHFYSVDQSAVKTIYITCLLKFADAAKKENSVNKACTYTQNRWQSLDGHHQVCDCCDSTCDLISQRRLNTLGHIPRKSASSDSAASAVVTVGPLIIRD